MLRVYYSNRTEELIAALGERIREERSSIFQPVHIVVGNRNMETYVKLSLARTLGICANVRFRFIGELVRDPRLTFDRVLAALFDDALLQHPELEPVRAYLEAAGRDRKVVDRRRVQLARRVAELFGAYEDTRPELLECWRAGLLLDEPDFRDVETWQRRLWLSLGDGASTTLPKLPSALHVFGVSYLARGQIHGLTRIEGVEIHLYTLNPCQEIWEAFTAPMPLHPSSHRYERRGKDLGPREIVSVEDPFRLANPGEMVPLRLWGRAGRENLRLLNALTGCELVPGIKVSEPSTLLEQLQRDIALRKPERTSIPRELDFKDDESIVIFEAGTVRRELEAIASEIWRLIALDKSANDDECLRFDDIAVILVPSVAPRYQALIGSVFGEMHRVPHHIVDLPVRGESRLAEAVDLLLRIPASRFTRRDVLRFVTHPVVMASFPDASADDWLGWCDELGIVHGRDRDDHAETYIRKDVFNWDQGLRRLALGAYMDGMDGGSGAEPLNGAIFHYGDELYLPARLDQDSTGSAGSFGLLVRSLLSDASEASRVQMTVPAWMDFMSAFITTYVHPRTPEDERVRQKCLSVAAAIGGMHAGGKKVGFGVARDLIGGEIAALGGTRGQYLLGGVAVSSFLPMRAIPFKVIFIAGLGEGLFPALARRDHLDLRQAQRRAGDLSPRERDKYLFLETLLSARKRLYLSYVARDELTGETLAPSSLVLELRETLEQGYVSSVPTRSFPLRRADDPAARRASPPAWREHRARSLGESLRAHLGKTAALASDLSKLELPAPVTKILGGVAPPPEPGSRPSSSDRIPRSMTLSAVRRFLECPLQGSARFALRLQEDGDQDRLSREDEKFRVEPLDRAQMLREAFLRGGTPESYDEVARRFELHRLTPTGIFGVSEREQHLHVLESWRKSLAAAAGSTDADLRLERRKPNACTIGDIRLEIGESALYLLTSPRLSVRLCAQRTSRFHARRESLHGFLDHVFHSAAGVLVGEPYTFVVINAAPGAAVSEPRFERFVFAPIPRETAARYLADLMADMRRGVHDYRLPCEVALSGGASLPLERTSSRFGPIAHPEDYDEAPPELAREIIDRRFGLYFESLGDAR